jgi:hypothetical protein
MEIYSNIPSIVMQYSFGQDDDLLEDEENAGKLRKNISDLLLGVKVNMHFPWIISALNSIPFFIAKHIMPPGALDMKTFSDVSFASILMFYTEA